MPNGKYEPQCGNCTSFKGEASGRRHCRRHSFVMPIFSDYVVCADWRSTWSGKGTNQFSLESGRLYRWAEYSGQIPQPIAPFAEIQELLLDRDVSVVENPEYGWSIYVPQWDLIGKPGEVISILLDGISVDFLIKDIEIIVTYTRRGHDRKLHMEDRREAQRALLPAAEGKNELLRWIEKSLSQRRADVSFGRRARDAYAALAYVRSLPYVDARRVGIMGGSHGGSTTLAAMIAPASDAAPLAREKRAGFAAAVALYPGCTLKSSGAYQPVAPLLILIGEKDDWTPAEPCRRLADAARAAGHPVSIKIYPGAHHSFDSPYPVRYVSTRVNLNSPSGYGATTGGDRDAWADSVREVAVFFGRHL